MLSSRLPRPLRLALYAVAVAILLWLCLSPQDVLPKPEGLNDKWQHALAWFVLTGLGIALSTWRWRAIALFALAMGVLVEVLQGLMGFGRDSDWRDVIADSIGIVVALAIALLLRRLLDRA